MTRAAIETPLPPIEPKGPPKPGCAIWFGVWTPYRAAIGVLIVCQIVQSLAALVLPSLSASVIDLGILHNDVPYIAEMSAAMLAAATVQIVFAVGAVWFGARIAMGIGRDLRSAVFARVQIFSLHEMRRFGAPSLITRTTNDVQQVQSFLVMALTMIISAPITGIGGVVMAVRQDGKLSLLLAISVPLLALLVGGLMALALPLYALMQGQIDRINQILREQITGLRVIRAFVRDGHERRRFGSANDEMTETALRVGRLMALNMPVAHLIMQLSSIAMVWFAAQRIAAGTLEVGALVAFLSYIMQILISVMIASMLFVMAPRALVSARRIEEVLQTPSSVAEPQTPSALPAPASHGVEIEFCNVTFAYPGAEQPVLSDVSFRVGPGRTVGVIGATGAGKSTIVNLIVRLFDVTGGAVRVNGIDVRNLALETLWSLIGLVPQASYLFSGTVAENLRYGRTEATDDELWHALEVAQAKELVLGLPEGLDAPVVQGGGNFSGGQRQRLAIARALVRRAPVYLFDDSFSALDYATEARLRLAFSKEAAAAATLIVGQRVNALRDADTILLLEHGAIAAAGSHDELMKASAAYRDIVASQQVGEGVTEEGQP